MHPFLKKVEHINARLIPYSLVLLFILIILELFVHLESHVYHLTLRTLDYLVITIFVIDLIFISRKCKPTSYFFRHYWLDILAVFPFAIAFHFISEIYRVFALSEKLVIGQAIFHETLEVGKEVSVASRTGRVAKYVRIVARSLRIITKSKFFTKFVNHKKK